MTLAARKDGCREVRLYRNFYLFYVRRRFGNSVAVDPHPFDVELNGLAHEFTRFLERRGGSCLAV